MSLFTSHDSEDMNLLRARSRIVSSSDLLDINVQPSFVCTQKFHNPVLDFKIYVRFYLISTS